MDASLRTGLSGLDQLLCIKTGLVTLRSRQDTLLARLAATMLARSFQRGEKALYLQWVEYHYRYWALDYDYLCATAKEAGIGLREFSDSVYFQRYFCKDNIQAEENWQALFAFPEKFGLIFLDSASELYDHAPDKKANDKPLVYSLGRFSQLLSRHGCLGVALDFSEKPIHPFLGEISSIVLDLSWAESLLVGIVKHPMLASSQVEVSLRAQQTLGKWSL